jgi:DNA-binding transcriptional MocR family regulator
MSTVQVTQLNIPAGMINFGVGQPDPALLPLEAMRQAAAHRLGHNDPFLLAYGVEQGDGYFRIALADFLSRGYGFPIHANDLFVTTGISQGLDFICTLFTQTGDTIFVEEPTYFLALRIFADHRLNLVGIPTDENGLTIEALEEELTRHRPALLYTIPAFHNPASVTLSAARRERLVELSQQHNFLVVADEAYQLLAYNATPPPSLGSYIETETVLSLGSFSKIMAPGLRLGWIQAGPKLIKQMVYSGLLDSGGGLNPFTSAMIRSAIELGLQDEQLNRLKAEYGRRAEILAAALRRRLPADITFAKPEGGFFIWLRFPEVVDTKALLTIARQHHVGFEPGISFSSRQGLRNYARVCFAYYDSPNLEEGVLRLAQAIEASPKFWDAI